MAKEEKTENIYTSLLRFQTENKWLVVKDSNNPFFKSKYADLTAISHACREGLNACGIVVVQEAVTSDRGAGCNTILHHAASNTFIASDLILPYGAKIDPQAAGSCITYARRYSLASLCGLVAADEDDDANYASGYDKPVIKESLKTQPKQYALKAKTEDKPHPLKTPLSKDEVPDVFTTVKEVFPDSDEIKVRFKYDVDKAPADKIEAIESYVESEGQKHYVYMNPKTGVIESEAELPKLKKYQIDLE